jgi:NAD(P)-dependent dehydrogenase (short-subunit alcohol dehydrogenase family)
MLEADLWQDQIVVVTGASGSIGGAIADRFEQLGARVASSDLAINPGMSVSGRRSSSRVDVTKSEQLDTWIEEVARRWGTPTIGVVCAGISKAGRLVETSDADWSAVIDVNLTGAFYTARAVIGKMVASSTRGRIVFVGSWAAHAPHPHIGAYSPSKAGMRVLCQTLALDHAADGILVNEVAPGIVDAGVSRELFRADPGLELRTRASIPSGLVLTPEDVARDVVTLSSPENLHTTGTALVSDGGLSLASMMNPGTQRN